MNTSAKREQYRSIRFDYYHAGRLLHMVGNFHGAGIMLGYAIETIMKASLVEVLSEDQQRKIKNLLYSHDIEKIFAECKRHNIFTRVQVSNEFLEHINNHFQRYPSQISSALLNADMQNKSISNSIDWINYYDDFIVQLDYHLFNVTADVANSIIYLAILTLETNTSRDILRENAFALLKFKEYSELILQNMPKHEGISKQINNNLKNGMIFYWNTNSQQAISEQEIVRKSQNYLASGFRIPKWINSNGKRELLVP